MKYCKAAAQLALVATLSVSAQSIAGTSQQHLFPNHDYSEFALPAVGAQVHEVTRMYGEPSNRHNGANGVNVWDYGTFRVIFKDDAVTYAAMW